MIAPSFFNRQQDFCDRFGARFGAEISFPVDPDAHCIGFHVAFSNHEHGVDLHLLGALDFAVSFKRTPSGLWAPELAMKPRVQL